MVGRKRKALVGAILLAATMSEAAAETEFALDLGPHKRVVKKWSAGNSALSAGNRFWLVARNREGGVRIAEMAESAGLKVLGAHRDRGMVVYTVETSGDPSLAASKLAGFPEFFALEPVAQNEKIRGALHGEREARLLRKIQRSGTLDADPMSDTVRVLVSHSLPRSVDVSIWAKRMGMTSVRIVSSSIVEGVVVWSRLAEVAADPVVRSVDRKPEQGPLNDRGRSIMNVAPLQYGASSAGFLDTSSAFTSTWNQSANAVGRGVVVGVFDGGVDDLHPDLRVSPAIGRRANLATPWNSNNGAVAHGTHVAGTILGSGAMSQSWGVRPYQFRGVAPWASLYSLYPDPTPHAVDVGNFSWIVMGTTGGYSWLGGTYDNLLADHSLGARPVYVFAVGNNGSGNQYGTEVGYFSTLNNMKNGIKVGAVDAGDTAKVEFSSLGPTRDGRLGPDVVAAGVGVVSSSIDFGGNHVYLSYSGTSMAAPHVSGVVALMHERFTRVTGRDRADHMWNSSARAILVHTARDLVRQAPLASRWNNPDFQANDPTSTQPLSDVYGPGPDWATGYGLVDAARAVDISGTSRVLEQVVDQGIDKTYQVSIPAGTAKFRATLVWDDPGAENYTGVWQKALLNDLDLSMTSPTGVVHRPWVLDASMINDSLDSYQRPNGIDRKVTLERVRDNPARPGVDSLNNLEVVDLSSPEAGVWTINVRPRLLTVDQNLSKVGTNQDFSLVTDIATGAAPDTGFLDLDIGITGGSRTTNGSVHTIRASGNDIWNNSDQFHFTYRTLSGDGSLAAKVTSLSLVSGSLDPWAKAGVMLREKLTGGSRHAMMELTSGNGALFQHRRTENGTSANVIQSGIRAPYWVRIDRKSDTITGFLSQDGRTWSQIPGARVVLPGLPVQIHAGLAVTAHTGNGSVVAGTFDLAPAVVLPPPAPANLSAVSGNGQISLGWSSVQGATSYEVRRWRDDPIQRILVYTGSQTSFVNIGLTNGLRYSYDVAAVNTAGTGPASAPVSATVGAQAPATPTGLAAVAGNGQASLSWNPVSGATTYSLLRYTTDSATRTSVYTGAATSFVNTGLSNGTTYRYQVVANGASASSAPSAPVGATPAAPQTWTEIDIASWGGAHTVSGGTHTVKGSGADIWNTSDQFHFGYRTLSGNGTLVARVASIGNTDPWAKAGLMFRESTAGNSRNVMVNVTPSNGVLLQKRLNPGESTSNTIVSGKAAPQWVKLSRSGNTFTAFWSADGANWTQIGSPIVFGSFASTALVGLAVTSHNSGAVTTAVFDNVSVP